MVEIEKLLLESGAILEGHFLLTSGRHSNKYVEKFRLLENPVALKSVCKLMSEKYKDDSVDLILGAAIGGILLCGGVGQELNVKHIFTERVDKKMVLKRGFKIEKHQRVVIVEDIITTGGSVFEMIGVADESGADLVGVSSIVDRSNKEIDFGVPYNPLLKMKIDSWDQDEVPYWLQKIPITKPGSTGK